MQPCIWRIAFSAHCTPRSSTSSSSYLHYHATRVLLLSLGVEHLALRAQAVALRHQAVDLLACSKTYQYTIVTASARECGAYLSPTHSQWSYAAQSSSHPAPSESS